MTSLTDAELPPPSVAMAPRLPDGQTQTQCNNDCGSMAVDEPGFDVSACTDYCACAHGREGTKGAKYETRFWREIICGIDYAVSASPESP